MSTLSVEECEAQFKRFDADGSGEISVEELVNAMKACVPDGDEAKIKELCAVSVFNALML